MRTRVPGDQSSERVARSTFCSYTVSRAPPLASTWYCVLTPKIRRIDDRAIERVVAARGGYVGSMQPDLLGPDADAQRVAAGRRCARGPDHGLVGEAQSDVAVVVAFDGRRQQVADPEEPGHERGSAALVQALGVAELLVLPAVHHGDAIGHRHRLLLVVGHVDERDPDFLLDALELDLHLLAELQVEGAQRLVEQEHRRPVDQRPRERDALRLPARDLGRLAAFEAGQLDEL